MRETVSYFPHLVVPKMNYAWKYVFHYITKKCTQTINELKADQKIKFKRLVL